jgi:hypothetical protein
MNIGLLWFENDPKKSLEQRVKEAADFYQNKHGHAPTLCFVHPSFYPAQPDNKPLISAGVEVRPFRSVMPNHYWIGVETL